MWAPVAFIAADLDGLNHVVETENLKSDYEALSSSTFHKEN